MSTTSIARPTPPTGAANGLPANPLLAILLSGNRKRILTAFKKYEPLDVQMAILQHITDTGGDMALPLYLLDMDERAARAFHRFCWSCIAQVESGERFVAAIHQAPRAAVYQLLAALADVGHLPRLYLAARELNPGPADLYMALCVAGEEGVVHLQEIGAPKDLPAARWPFLESPLGCAARAGDRVSLRTMLLQMHEAKVDPAQWLSRHRKDMPAWAYRILKSVWAHMLQSNVVPVEGQLGARSS